MNSLFQLIVGFFLLNTAALAEEEESAPEPVEVTESKESTESKASQEQGANNYKTLQPIIISIIKSGKVYGYLRLEIQLATTDGGPIEHLEPLYPILVDAYTTQLYSLICDRWIPDQPLNQESILKIIQDLTTKITKERANSDNLKAYLKNFFFAPANK